jgi:hydrogenase-4 component B
MNKLFLISLLFPLVGAFLNILLSHFPRLSKFIGTACILISSVAGIIVSLDVFVNGLYVSGSFALSLPMGNFQFGIDILSAFFLIPVFVIGPLCSIYSMGHDENHSDSSFFNSLLIFGMILVFVSKNALLFLIAWEVMMIASFFLVTHETEKPESERAGVVYLITAHFGMAFLLFFFIFLSTKSGSLDFDSFSKIVLSEKARALVFLFSLIGFGTKAGLLPLHIWLPEAYPAAPSHVSALMSGVMINTGIYGILRTICFLGSPEEWWGYLLMIAGIAGGIYGILFALVQTDIKRLLAYSSVENVGIITLGIGTGIVCSAKGIIIPSVLAFSGAFLHIVNHSIYKSMLFLCVGTVINVVHTRDINCMGGLMKKMPRTALAAISGSAAISGLPPLNGFVSEFLIYSALFSFLVSVAPSQVSLFTVIFIVICITSLALIGGLAAACFTKFFGLVFSGELRKPLHEEISDPGISMLFPMLTLAFLCVVFAGLSSFVIPFFAPLIASISGIQSIEIIGCLKESAALLRAVLICSGVLILFIALIANLRRTLLAGRTVEQTVTWDCGYAAGTARMQYTGFSFSKPLADVFKFFIRPSFKTPDTHKLFPENSSYEIKLTDLFQKKLFDPLIDFGNALLIPLHCIQHGRVQTYILYLALTLISLLVWNLW